LFWDKAIVPSNSTESRNPFVKCMCFSFECVCAYERESKIVKGREGERKKVCECVLMREKQSKKEEGEKEKHRE